MRYRLIILSVFWAMLGCVPTFAANDTPEPATETAIEQTVETNADADMPPDDTNAEDAAEAIIDQDEEVENIKDQMDSIGWCADADYTDSATDNDISLDQENEGIPADISINRGSNDERRKEICNKLKEIKSLESELNANLDELADNAREMKENEQSLANRTLSSVTMAATGIGGMELAQGLSEQKSDKAAEADMTAYLSTFQCKVGDKRYKGTDKNIEIPGANQLTKLYQDYVDLAASLKERKAALGMQPGIEAEVVLDKAHTGLYDDVGHGIENGTFASLYRASKGNENDIKKLEDAKAASKKRVVGGAVAAGAGVVAGIVGNAIINKGKHDRSGEILAKRNEIKSRFNEVAQELVEECNKNIRAHKELITTLTPEQLSDPEMAEYKRDVEAAKEITSIEEIKGSLFCK